MYSICILVFLIRNLAISTSQNVLSSNNEEDKEEILHRERRSVNFYQTGHKLQSEMSKTLDQLLGPNYNKRIRPNYGGPPVLVELNLSIRSIVSDTIGWDPSWNSFFYFQVLFWQFCQCRDLLSRYLSDIQIMDNDLFKEVFSRKFGLYVWLVFKSSL